MKIAVFGAGYVGCVSAACLSQLGHRVIMVDKVPEKVDSINSGSSPIHEPGLADLVKRMVCTEKRLSATLHLSEALAEAEIALICVGTPNAQYGKPDLSALKNVINSILEYKPQKPLLLVIRSTVPAGMLREIVAGAPLPGSISIVNNPEFLRESSAIHDFHNPPFIVIGGDDGSAAEKAKMMYEGVNAPKYITTLENAALIKYASNAYHALKITFANEIAAVCAQNGADPVRVMELLREDRILNVSPAYLRPGFAFGGSCLPRTCGRFYALAKASRKRCRFYPPFCPATASVWSRPFWRWYSGRSAGWLSWGITFKSGSDDLRESPYVDLAEQLIGKGFEITIFDPDINPERMIGANLQYMKTHLPHLARHLTDSIHQSLEWCQALVLCKKVLPAEKLKDIVPKNKPVYDLEYALRPLQLDNSYTIIEPGP